MAVTLMDGFDTYSGWTGGTGICGMWGLSEESSYPGATDVGRFGGRSIYVNNSNGKQTFTRALPAPQDRGTIGHALKTTFSINGVTTGTHVRVRDGATPQLGWKINVANKAIDIVRPSSDTAQTVLGSTANNVLVANQWHYIEFEFVIHDTLGEARIWIDNELKLSLTNVDTKNSTTSSTFNLIDLGGTDNVTNGYPIHFDDLYVTDTPARLGECVIDTLYMNGDDTVGWVPSSGTTNFEALDEATASTAEYIAATAVGTQSLLNATNLTVNPETIHALNVKANLNKTDTLLRTVSIGLKSGGVVTSSASRGVGINPHYMDFILNVDPNTLAPWQVSGVNAAQPRIALTA